MRRFTFLSIFSAIGVALVCPTGAATHDHGPGFGPELEGYAYPWPVQHFRFTSQGDSLDMVYMDVMPAKPNGQTAVLLHGKNFCAATWQATVAVLSEAGYRVIAPDQIGFCTSTKPRHYQFTFQQLATNTHAVLAVYGYNWLFLSPQLNPLVDQWLLRPIEPYWLPNLRLLWHGYRTVDFPFEEIIEPRLALYLSWNLDQLLKYCRTWSATRSKIAAEGEQFLATAHDVLAGAWGNPDVRRTVVMPIAARLGRVP